MSRRQANAVYNANRREQRGADPRGTQAWKRARAKCLAQHPWCADPFHTHSVPVAATQVDHIVPVTDGDVLLSYDPVNLQALCTACHGRKTRLENAGVRVNGYEWATKAEKEVSVTLAIEQWPIERISPSASNPRKIPESAIVRVARSLQEFGFRQPIVVDAQGEIIAGHVRLRAAQRLGLAEVPVHVAHDLTPQQIRAYRIVDNSANELSDWDQNVLYNELEALQEFDETLLGYAIPEPGEAEVEALTGYDFSLVRDECLITVRAPLPLQAEIMRKLKELDLTQIKVDIDVITT